MMKFRPDRPRKASRQNALARAAASVNLETLESRRLLSGSGLKAEYFNNADLTAPALTRTDETIDFNWGRGSPDSSIAADTFSARWSGKIQPRYSETYTFEATTDDGVRLWVDGKLVIDHWDDQSAKPHSGSITLNAGQMYDLKMEYYDNTGKAVATLAWSSASQAKEIIPASQLFLTDDTTTPTPPPPQTTDPTVTLTLIDADSDKPIGTLAGDSVIDFAETGTKHLSIRADVSGEAESVVFSLDDNATFKVESDVPYAIMGDGSGGSDYYAWTPALGDHTLTVTPYTGDKASGSALTPVSVKLHVVDSTVTEPAPEPTPEPTPTPEPEPTPEPPPPTTPGTIPDPNALSYQAAFTITRGGTYTGNFQSLDASKAVITIATSEPVVLQNMVLRGKSHLIVVNSGVDANLTVRNVYGFGMNPDVNGKYPGRFLYANSFKSIDVQHCYMESTSGMYLYDSAPGASVKVMYNEAKNIDGRKSDGNGGWQDPSNSDSFFRVQFFQINQCSVPNGMEIAWNKVVNEPGKSRVEDNISIHRTSGTEQNPILIHDNFINGAYPVNWADGKFSGGGIITDGGYSSSRGESAFVKIYNNTVMNTSNYGIAIATGHDNQIYNNRVFATGKVDGVGVRSTNVGIYIWDYSNDAPDGHFYNNYAYNNVVGWQRADGSRNDYWLPDDDGARSVNNAKYSGAVTDSVISAELQRWLDGAADFTIGPVAG